METHARLMSAYLPTAPDAAWLYAACDSNCDGNGERIRWMADQPACPEAAALAIDGYLGARYHGPYRHRDAVPAYALRTHDLLQVLQQCFLQGDHKVGAIGFDPRNDPTPIGSLTAPGLDWTAQYEGAANLPDAMKAAVPGPNKGVLDMPEVWIEGMPPEIAAVVLIENEDE